MIELKINNVNIDVSEDVPFPITFSQSDAKNPEKRKRNFTKTIVLPGTSVNNRFFSSAYDIHLTDSIGDLVGFDFDPTLRYPAIARKNGKVCFRGSVNLTKVVTKSDLTNGRVNEFHVVLYSDLADLFQGLGDTLISELGWSEYNHDLNFTNVVNSWSATTGSGYWYPLIDYGFNVNPLDIKLDSLRVHVYFLEIIEKCFTSQGYTLSSVFLNTPLIRRIVFGSGGGTLLNLTDSQIDERLISYTGDGSRSYSLAPTLKDRRANFFQAFAYTQIIGMSDNSALAMTIVQDDLLQYNESSGNTIAANSGNYLLTFQGTFPITYDYDVASSDEFFKIEFKVRIFVNGAWINSSDDSAVFMISTGTSGTTNAVFNIEKEIYLYAGDVLRIDFQIKSLNSWFETPDYVPVNLDIDIDFDSSLVYQLSSIDNTLTDGDTVDVARFLPEMKAVDFLNDVITMFNLYLSDPNENNAIICEPENLYFFDSDDTDDYSKKLDRSQPIEIEPAANIEGKVYRFKFAEDRDYYKQLYFDNQGIDYGDFDYNVPSTFKKGEKIYQTKLAQSVPVEIEGTDIIIPRIVKIDNASGVISPHKGKPRFYFNNGLVDSDSWNLSTVDGTTTNSYNSYPQAHHLDDLTDAGFDLNFGKPEFVYYTATSYTDANLFYEHNAPFIRNLTGRDSKLLNAWFKLDENDFYENFMRRLCLIDGALFRKNMVKDWIANSNNLVKVELLKITNGTSQKNFQTTLPGGVTPNPSSGGGLNSDGVAIDSQGYYIIDSSLNDVTMSLDPARLRPGWEGDFIKASQGNDLILSPVGPATISGAATLTISNQWAAVRVRFDGTNFYTI